MNDMTQNSGGMTGGMGGTMQSHSLTPKTLDEAMRYAEVIAGSEVVPADYKGKPGNVLVAMQMGMEVGLPPLQALQNIAVINGRPAIWGDSLIAIVRAHPLCDYVREDWDDQRWVATCRVKRRGEEEQIRTFSADDAKAADLMGKKGPWQSYPKRMIQMRARAFALRDVFPDALRGMAVAEEVKDIPAESSGSTPSMQPAEATVERPALPQYPDDRFEENFPKWSQAIQDGKLDAETVIAKAASTYELTEQQKERIRSIGTTTTEETA